MTLSLDKVAQLADSSQYIPVMELQYADYQAFCLELSHDQGTIPQWAKEITSEDDVRYNEWQNSTSGSEALTDGILEDGLQFLQETSRHEELAELPSGLGQSTPLEEHWSMGIPSHSHYAVVQWPTCMDPFSPEDIREIIGRVVGSGFWRLSKLTEEQGLHYVWWNQDPTSCFPLIERAGKLDTFFELWGTQDRLPQAVHRLQNWISNAIQEVAGDQVGVGSEIVNVEGISRKVVSETDECWLLENGEVMSKDQQGWSWEWELDYRRPPDFVLNRPW